MKQTAVEWLTEKLKNEFGFAFSNNIFEQAKEMEKQQQGYSEEELKEIVYHMVGELAKTNNMTFNGAILDELFKQIKKK